MMKKGMIAISAAITAAVLSGCASRSSEDPDSPAAVNPDSEAAVQVIESYERLQRFGYDLFAQNIQDQVFKPCFCQGFSGKIFLCHGNTSF